MKRAMCLCVVSALVGAWISSGVLPSARHRWLHSLQAQPPAYRVAPENRFAPPEAAPIPRLTQEEEVCIGVYESANRSVVNINTKSVRQDLIFFEIPSEGAGSGSVLDKEGHILTNFHVVDGAERIEVTLASGNTYRAKLVGRSPLDDVAVLQIAAQPEELHPIRFADSTPLRVGQNVYAIGNPFGLERTLTRGIISSLNRTLPSRATGRVMKTIIQIDAAMNPGNSGRPLLNSSGEVIGMNMAIASSTGQNTGVGFAIPSSRIVRILPELVRNGFVARPETGIARVMETERGLLIATLMPHGPAEQAGLQGFRVVRKKQQRGVFTYETQEVDRSAADLITGVNGQPIKTAEDFLSIVEERKPGDTVDLSIVRRGKQMVIPLTLGVSEP